MRKILLALFALLPLLGAQEKPSAPAEAPILDVSVEHGLPGSLPGTERWIVLFKQRSFDLSDFRSAVYSGASAAEVARIVKDLEDEVKADQADFARFIEKLGGKVVVQWWIINGCAVDIPFDKLDQVRRNPRVAFVEPDRIRKPLAPILTSTNTRNHVVDPLQAQGYMAKGVSVAIMDTGQDSNMGGTGRPHATYYVNGDINNKTGGGIGGSRLLANIKVGAANPDDVHGHGTGVAGIAAGEKWNKASFSDRGHAPMAGIVGYSIANSSNGSSTSTVMTTAWQKIAADKVKYGIVAANNSYTGSPNPLESTQRALDSAALNADILPVVAAGNRSSSTRSSQSVVNGLAVGAVNPTIKKMASFSSRGPLYGDSRRFYPDLCACGVGTVMPRRNNEGSYYRASGTSMASPQVCGAATLFRSVAKKATALETKAALLASTEDISKQNPSPPYNTRNAYGLGFLRDDRALEIAKGNGLLMTSTLTKAAPKKIIPMAVKAGKAYSVVIAWHRQSTSTTQWSNLALTIRFLGRVIGSSDTPRNLYEKVVFVAPSTGKVSIEVTASFLEKDPLPFAVAALEVPAPFIPGTVTSFGKGCKGTGTLPGIGPVAPTAYANKWGESRTALPLGYYNHRIQHIYSLKALPSNFTATGMAFRHDNRYVRSASHYWIELSISMGYTTRTPSTISSSFSANITGPMVQVLSKKKINLPYWTSVNTSPSNWDIKIPFTKPFTYTAQAGKQLLVDFHKTNSSRGNTYTYYWVDAVSSSSYLVSRVYARGSNPSTGIRVRGFGAALAFTRPAGPGAIPVLSAAGTPQIGSSFTLDLAHARASTMAGFIAGLSNTRWRSFNLPFDLSVIGAPGCNLLVGLDLVVLARTNSSGAASLRVAVPNDKALIQSVLYWQALVIDPPANRAGLAWTNGLRTLTGGQP